jgi:hypothetical protein
MQKNLHWIWLVSHPKPLAPISSASPLDCQEYIINCCFDMRCICSLSEVTWIKLTFEKWLSPNLTRGVVGNIRWGLITSDPFLRLYKLLITSSRSDVFLTGRNRLRGTLIPAIPILGSQNTWLRWLSTLKRQQMERLVLWEDHKMWKCLGKRKKKKTESFYDKLFCTKDWLLWYFVKLFQLQRLYTIKWHGKIIVMYLRIWKMFVAYLKVLS